MSSFICEHCGAVINYTPFGYATVCEHWPIEEDEDESFDLEDRLWRALEETRP